jgi:hypothetical protein
VHAVKAKYIKGFQRCTQVYSRGDFCMRKIVIFTMILTFIFAMAGCTAQNEPDKKAIESSSANVIIDITQAEELTEKTGNETVEKSTFAEETTQPPTAKTDTEKMSKEAIITSATTDKSKSEEYTHFQNEVPKNEI